MILVIPLAVAALAASPQALSVVMPQGVPGGSRSAAIVCRDSRGGWATTLEWREVAGATFALPAAGAGHCRVLVKPSGTMAFLASNEMPLKSGAAIFIGDRWLRNIDAPAAGADLAWFGAGGDEGVECVPVADRSRCWFVPLASAGVLVSRNPPRFQFAIVPAGDVHSVAAWREAVWGRLIRARSPSRDVTAAVIALHDSLKHGAGRLREARPAPGVTITRLRPDAFWIEGIVDPAAHLELRGEGAATTRVSLSTMASPGAAIVDVSLPHHQVITGEVRSGGSIVEGATVMLSGILDTPGTRVPEDERPRERIAESTTGQAGEFRFESLGAGKYELFVVHPSMGRRTVVVSPPSHARLQLEPRAVIRGRVLRHGIPVPGALVQALPSIDAVAAARNPAALSASGVRSAVSGRFEVIAPDEGRVTLSVVAEGGAFRVELGEAAALPRVTDVGEITLDEPVAVELLIDLPGGCEVRAAGPMGAAGLTAIHAEAAGQGRWILRPAHPGRWIVAGVCAGKELALEPAVITVPLARAGPILLKVRR